MLELTRRMLAQDPLAEIPADNRRLVEGATHPDRLTSLTGELWEQHGQTVSGATLAQERPASRAAADYDTPFNKLESPPDLAKNAQARTRLGLGNLRVPLPGAPTGPFGLPCPEITIPGHLMPDLAKDEAPTNLRMHPDGLRFTLSGVRLRYTRFGLEKDDEPAD